MSYRKRGKWRRHSKLPPFVPLTWDLLNSKAYKGLTPSAAKELPYFLGKAKVPLNEPERYAIEFDFTYTEARNLGFSNSTHHRNICALIEHGFIDGLSKGGLRGCGQSKSRFKLSRRWEDYGSPRFKKTRDWKLVIPKF